MAYRSLENTIKDAMRSTKETLGENVEWVCGKCNCDPCTCGEELNEAKKPTNMQIHKVLYPTKNSREGIAALKKAFRVNDAEAKKMLDRVMNEANELSEGGHEDKKSAMNKVKIAMSALNKMQTELQKLPDDADLPSWWVGKVAIAVDKLDGMADYLDTQVEQVTEEIDGKQLVHHGETTKNFEICPSALKAFNDNQKAGMGDKDGFHEAVVAVDKYLGIEKALTKKGSATEADMDKMKAAVEDAKQKIKAAGLPGHDYHGIHIKAVEELMKEEVNEKTLTPAEKKKREEVAQAIERDNPDMPMAKKMAIATATAKRVAEEKVDELSMSIKDIKKTGLNKAATAGKDKLKKDLEKLKKNLGEEEIEEARGTSAKYADKSGMFGGKYTSKDHMIGMKNFSKIRDKRAADRAAQHKQQDPKMAKMGYAKHMLDTDKADAKARKRGIDPTGKYDKYKKRNNLEQTNEVLDTPKAMDSYRNKAKYSKDRAANSAAAKMLRNKDGFKSTDTSPELKTMDKRTAGLKMVDRNAARKFRKSMNESEMAITRRGDYGMEKVRMPDGSYKWKKKPKKEISVESRDSDTKNDK